MVLMCQFTPLPSGAFKIDMYERSGAFADFRATYILHTSGLVTKGDEEGRWYE